MSENVWAPTLDAFEEAVLQRDEAGGANVRSLVGQPLSVAPDDCRPRSVLLAGGYDTTRDESLAACAGEEEGEIGCFKSVPDT